MRNVEDEVFDDSTEAETIDEEDDDSSPIQERAFKKGYDEEIEDPLVEKVEVEEEW